MTKLIRQILVSGLTMLVLDGVYISMIKKDFTDQIINIQRVAMTIRWAGVFVCYFFLIFGLNYFIIGKSRSIMEAFYFGLVIYAVYESTNYATLKNWTAKIAIIDTLWGGTLMALTTYITYRLV
uniref:DUF2177 family protein n=1 Tax=viral metagenome TaxID=1070528 RepID=A0A6C0JH78_9ZZZZ